MQSVFGHTSVGPLRRAPARHPWRSRARILAVLVCALGWSAPARAADEIHWTIIGQTSVTLDWRGCENTVRYGPTPAYGQVAAGLTPSPLPFSSAGPFWEARLTNLQENTLYHYSIGNGPDHTLRTPPSRGASGFTAFVAGDIGDSANFWRMAELQTLIAAQAPDFVLMVGDLTYGNSQGQMAVDGHFNDVMKWSQEAAYMPAWGNHEWDDAPDDDLRNYKGRFDLPNPQTSPGAPPEGCCGEDWYWFDYGNVRFIAFPEPYTPATLDDWYSRALALMDQAQSDPAIAFIVTYGHRPAYSSGHHPGKPSLKNYLDQLGATHGKYVLNLGGHSHNYERTYPQNGVVHITAGTGGSNLEQDGACLWEGGCPPPAWSAYRAMRHVAVQLRFTASAIEGTVYCGPAGGTSPNINDVFCTPGEVVDSFIIGSGQTTTAIYVDGAHPACSDAGPGTESQPYCTISAAVAAHAGPGSVIVVRPGVYREQVTVPASGAAGNPFIVRAEGEGVVIDGADDLSSTSSWLPYSGDVWLAPSVSWSPKQVIVDGVPYASVSGSPSALLPEQFYWKAGEGLYLDAGGGNPGLRQTFAGRRNFGFFLSGSSWVTIEGFEVTRAEDRGFQLQNGSSNVTMRGNTVSFAYRNGIQIVGGSGQVIEDNQVSDNGDHGIALISGVTGSTVGNNESFRNVRPASSGANGIYLFGAPANVIVGNRVHDNQDTGLQIQSGSNDCLAAQNRSWMNGDHGFDHLYVTGTSHVGDVAWGNRNCGFIVQGTSTGTRIQNCVASDNGLQTGLFNLSVDASSVAGLDSDSNVFWNSNGQPGFRIGATPYATLAQFQAASGQETWSLEADPRFVNPVAGDFQLAYGSPAVDSGDSGVPGWPALDAEGYSRADDLTVWNSGAGSVAYADRGSLEYQPTPPSVNFAATPSTGVGPLLVNFDASGSTDPDGPVVSYEIDFGDGGLLVGQPSPVALHLYSPGTWMATVVASDSAGHVAQRSVPIVVAPPPSAPNLVGNPSFESDFNGWIPYQGASLLRVPGGFQGSYALQVAGPASASTFGITDSPNLIGSTTAGTRYRVTAWVRTPGTAGQARIGVQEFSGGAAVAPRLNSALVALACLWQPVTLDYEAQASGSVLDMQIVNLPIGFAETFQVDHVTAEIVAPGTTDVFADSTALRPLVPLLAPNPILDRATLRFATSRRGFLRVDVYDVAGRRVRTLLDAPDAAPGEHVVAIDARSSRTGTLGAGLYFYRIHAAEGSVARRFLVVP